LVVASLIILPSSSVCVLGSHPSPVPVSPSDRVLPWPSWNRKKSGPIWGCRSPHLESARGTLKRANMGKSRTLRFAAGGRMRRSPRFGTL
jgi:hypothetical protein